MKTITLLISLLLHPLYAFTFNTSTGAAFDQDSVSVNVSSITCNNIGVSNAEILVMVQEAIDQFWNQVPTSDLELVAGSIVSVTSNFGTSDIEDTALAVSNDILISCNTNTTNFSNAAVLAAALPNNFSNSNTIQGALILINDRSGNSFANLDRESQVSTIAHEIGHALGLGHSSVEDSLMFFATRSNRFDLGEDDIDGISYLYPKEEPFGGCGTIDLQSPLIPPFISSLIGVSLAILLSLLMSSFIKAGRRILLRGL